MFNFYFLFLATALTDLLSICAYLLHGMLLLLLYITSQDLLMATLSICNLLRCSSLYFVLPGKAMIKALCSSITQYLGSALFQFLQRCMCTNVALSQFLAGNIQLLWCGVLHRL